MKVAKIVSFRQWWILGEANEADVCLEWKNDFEWRPLILGQNRKIRDRLHVKTFFFLENNMILGRKQQNWRSIRSEDLFFFFFLEKTMILGRK